MFNKKVKYDMITKEGYTKSMAFYFLWELRDKIHKSNSKEEMKNIIESIKKVLVQR
jgi:hypothetical protein